MSAVPNPLPEGSEKNSVKASGADKLGYQIAVGDLPGIKDTKLDGWKTFDELRQDIWTSAFRPSPELVQAADMQKTHQPNSQVMAAVMKSPFWNRLHEDTKFDELKSAEATVLLAEKLPEILKEWPRDPNQPGDGDSEGEGEEGEGQGQGQPTPGAAPPSDLQQKIDEALKQTQQELKENEQILDAAGAGAGKGQSAEGELNAKERVDLANELKNSGMFKKLAKMVGRMTLAANNARASQFVGRTAEVGGFELSDNIMQAIPSELMLLKKKRTRLLFLKKLADKQLMCKELHSDESLERGPMVVCLDRSGSMAGHIGHGAESSSRFDWGKAVTLALMSVCRKQRRGLTLITFCEAAQVIFRSPTGRLTAKQILNVSRLMPQGGTSFNAALDTAFKEIREKHNMKQADIVFVTDGEDQLDYLNWITDAEGKYVEDPNGLRPKEEKVIATKDELNVRIWGVQVEASGSTDCLKKFSDRVANLSDEKGVLDMVFGKATT